MDRMEVLDSDLGRASCVRRLMGEELSDEAGSEEECEESEENEEDEAMRNWVLARSAQFPNHRKMPGRYCEGFRVQSWGMGRAVILLTMVVTADSP